MDIRRLPTPKSHLGKGTTRQNPSSGCIPHSNPTHSPGAIGLRDSDLFTSPLNILNRVVASGGISTSVSSLPYSLGFCLRWLPPGKMVLRPMCRKKTDQNEPNDPEDNFPREEFLNSLRRAGMTKFLQCVSKRYKSERRVSRF